MQPDARTDRNQIAQGAVPSEIGQTVVGMRRQHQIDLDTTTRRQGQRHQQPGVGNEIRTDRQNSPLRGKTAGDQQRMDRVVRPIRTAGDQLRQASRFGRRRFGVRRRRRRAIAGKRPVLLELLQGLRGQFAVHIKAEVKPGRSTQDRTRIALEILGCQIPSAAPEALRVGDEHLAVIAQIGSAALGRTKGWHETHDIDAGFCEFLQIGIAAHVNADAVDQQPHPDPGPRPPHEPFGNLVAQYVTSEKEGRHVERVFGAVDQTTQRNERLRAVFMHAQPRVGHRRRQAHGQAQLLRARRRGMRGRCRKRSAARALCRVSRQHLAATKGEIERQGQVGNEQDAHHPGDRRRRMAALVQAM